jgi:hypothetical protein
VFVVFVRPAVVGSLEDCNSLCAGLPGEKLRPRSPPTGVMGRSESLAPVSAYGCDGLDGNQKVRPRSPPTGVMGRIVTTGNAHAGCAPRPRLPWTWRADGLDGDRVECGSGAGTVG